MSEQRFELLRSTSAEEVSSTVRLLTDAGVPHKVSTNRAGFEITDIGMSGVLKDVLLTVSAEDYPQAREFWNRHTPKVRCRPAIFSRRRRTRICSKC